MFPTYNWTYEAIYLSSSEWPSPSYILLYVALGEKALDTPGVKDVCGNVILYLGHVQVFDVPARGGSRVVVPDVHPPHRAQAVGCTVGSETDRLHQWAKTIQSSSIMIWDWCKTHLCIDFMWSFGFHLMIKVSWEFLLNRVHPGTCSYLVCEKPSSPLSTMYTC